MANMQQGPPEKQAPDPESGGAAEVPPTEDQQVTAVETFEQPTAGDAADGRPSEEVEESESQPATTKKGKKKKKKAKAEEVTVEEVV